MPQSHAEVYVHVVWATADRQALLTGETGREIARVIRHECVELGAEVVALGGMADHVHVLIRLPARVSLAELAKQTKGASARLANQGRPEHLPFHWQGGYAAFSVSPQEVEAVARYVRSQAAHHRAGTLRPAWEMDEAEG